jgi:hypothetical protein
MLVSYVYASGQVGRYAPSAVRVGGDPGMLLYRLFSEKRSFFEAEGDIDIDRFFLVADWGLSGVTIEEPTYKYENDGTYRRFGIDINFMHDDPNLNVAFFGIRHGHSNFSDKLDYKTQAVIQSDIKWPNTTETTSNDWVRANWLELNTGLKIRVVKQLYMGFTVRYKLFLALKGTEDLRPYYIPGFGKNIGTSAAGFNYYISYRLPFRKKIIYTDTKKDKPTEKEKKAKP